ncbi:MAG: hypothetical protein ACLGI9_21265, partial [Thermoanaerobaculia bacterium]
PEAPPPPPPPPPPPAKPVPARPAKKAAPPAPEPLPELEDWMLPPPIPEYQVEVRRGVVPEPEAPAVEMWTSPTAMDWVQNEPEPPPPPPRPPSAVDDVAAPRANLRPALKMVSNLLAELLAPANPNLSSFKMTQRLLSKHARIPAAMFQSIQPYLKEVQERLVPALKQITPFRGITDEAVVKLEGYCTELRRPSLSPSELKDEVPKKMERLVRLLEALRAAVPTL